MCLGDLVTPVDIRTCRPRGAVTIETQVLRCRCVSPSPRRPRVSALRVGPVGGTSRCGTGWGSGWPVSELRSFGREGTADRVTVDLCTTLPSGPESAQSQRHSLLQCLPCTLRSPTPPTVVRCSPREPIHLGAFLTLYRPDVTSSVVPFLRTSGSKLEEGQGSRSKRTFQST